jgi:RNA polymerase sigma-70 factor (sigma-E family)
LAAAERPVVLHLLADPEVSAVDDDRDRLVAELFATHYSGLCRLAGLLLADRSGAEEAVQEAFVRTFSSWRRIRQPDRAQRYLRTAVVNECRSRVRRRATEDRSNRTAYATGPERIEVTDGTGDGTGGTDDAMTVLAAVRSLPPRQREAVVLRYYEDLPEREIAALLGCSQGTVKSQLSKARASLAAALGAPIDDGGRR